MKFKTQTAIGLIWLVSALPIMAQESANPEAEDTSEAVELEAIDIQDSRAPAPPYRSFLPEESGLTVMDSESITGFEDGSGDALDVLRLLPNVHFDVNQFSAEDTDLQDLRPSDISISGGQVYDNTIRIDGVAVDNVMDISEDNPANYNEVAGSAAQTIFLDPSLIDSLEVRDSNISARYGEFSGGVVDAKLRGPDDEFGASLRFGYESDELTDYVVDDADLAAADPPPEFTRWRLHGTVDVPVNEQFGLLFGFGRSQSEVDYAISDAYGGTFRGLNSTSDNFLVKGKYEFANGISLVSSLVYSPYESEYANANGIDNLIVTQGGGLTFKTEIDGETGVYDWLVRASYVDADMSREASPYNYSWDSDAPSIDFCTNTNCATGGFGDLEQYQRDYTLEAEASRDLLGGLFSFGGEVGIVDAFKARNEESRAYSRGSYDENTVCADASDLACIDGEIALPVYFAYLAYEANVEIAQASVWAEQASSFGPVDVRAGVRVSTDDYLENTNIAPRLSAVWNINDDWQLTGGANRYYTRNFVGYAIREQYPDFYRYERSATVSGTDLIYSEDDWALASTTTLTGYRDAGLETPYSDELTAALTFPALDLVDGLGRLKVVHRQHRNQIVRSPREDITEYDDDGNAYTRRAYFPSNEGETDYLGISAEWTGSWRNHSFTLNAAWSETVNNADDLGTYFDGYDAEDLATDFILFQGNIISLAELQDEAYRENFATPLTLNAAVRSSWLSDKLDTTVWFYWKDEYETIGDTGVNEAVDGTNYDVYDYVTREASLRVDLNASYELPDFGTGHQVELEARVSNLFSELPYTDVSSSVPYQRGRSIWLGVNWVY
tara:strand:+ start:5401 stop:7923 length:2523 start_codon:yes stop_codon:yes gene_type:complete